MGDPQIVVEEQITIIEAQNLDFPITPQEDVVIVSTQENLVSVISDVQQGVIGPQGIPGTDAGGALVAQNKDIVALRTGQPVAVHSSGVGVVGANSSDNAKNAIGLMKEDVNPGFSGIVQTGGIFDLADWTNVTGAVSLAARAVYFLDIISGKLTTIPPSITGQVVQKVGESVSTTSLKVEVEEAILL